MTDLHEVLGIVVIALNVAAGAWGLAVYRGWLPAGRAFAQVLALSHTLVLGQGLVGLLLLAGNRRPADSLHYVYGGVPAVLVLFGYTARTDDTRRNVLVFALVALVIGGLTARAYTTGAS